MRWVCEATWSGYRASQAHVCHRHVITNKKTAERFGKINMVVFTDGTSMTVSVRPCAPREKVQEKNGYKSLLTNFAYRDMFGVCRVEDLCGKRELVSA